MPYLRTALIIISAMYMIAFYNETVLLITKLFRTSTQLHDPAREE